MATRPWGAAALAELLEWDAMAGWKLWEHLYKNLGTELENCWSYHSAIWLWENSMSQMSRAEPLKSNSRDNSLLNSVQVFQQNFTWFHFWNSLTLDTARDALQISVSRIDWAHGWVPYIDGLCWALVVLQTRSKWGGPKTSRELIFNRSVNIERTVLLKRSHVSLHNFNPAWNVQEACRAQSPSCLWKHLMCGPVHHRTVVFSTWNLPWLWSE